jgi:hypothetical protein
MTLLRHYVAAALIVTPTLAAAQDGSVRLGQKQKAWMVANFRTGLACAASPGGSAVSFSGQALFDASSDGGIEISVTTDGGGMPVVTAHAINTKGTGGSNHRAAAQACAAGGGSSDGAASCSLWGDPHEADVRFTVPLSALGELGKSKELTGHVTLIKRSPDLAARALLSKKGYDYYKAQSDLSAAGATANPAMTLLATCDSSKLTSKGEKPMIATYDLVLLKK